MKISIIIPAYNAQEFIGRALSSLERQTSFDFEVLVVDDGSTDHTRAVAMASWMSAETPISWRIITIPHAGVSVASNRGIEEAKGEYIVFLGADDYVAPHLVQAVSSAIARGRPEIIAWGWDTVDTDGKVLRRYFDVHPPIPTAMTGIEALGRRVIDRSLRLWAASAAYRRDWIRNEGLAYAAGCACGEDLEFAYRALARARWVEFLPETLSFYVRRLGSVTKRDDVQRFQSVAALKRVHSELCTLPGASFREIAAVFYWTKLTRNYFYTLATCLGHRDTVNVRGFLSEVEAAFPGLNEEMRGIVFSRVRMGHHVPAEQRLFLFSPVLWWWFVKVRDLTNSWLPSSPRSTSASPARRMSQTLRSGLRQE